VLLCGRRRRRARGRTGQLAAAWLRVLCGVVWPSWGVALLGVALSVCLGRGRAWRERGCVSLAGFRFDEDTEPGGQVRFGQLFAGRSVRRRRGGRVARTKMA